MQSRFGDELVLVLEFIYSYFSNALCSTASISQVLVNRYQAPFERRITINKSSVSYAFFNDKGFVFLPSASTFLRNVTRCHA